MCGSIASSSRTTKRSCNYRRSVTAVADFPEGAGEAFVRYLPLTSIRRLSVGSTGAPVRKLEQQLKQRGLLQGPVDGFFDAKTKAAVTKFEHQNGWKENGIVGERIARRLDLGLATTATAAADAPAKQKGGRQGAFDVVSMNVKSNPVMPQEQVRHDVRRAAKSGDIIGWQEIEPERYRDEIRRLPGFDHFMPKGLHTPISWRSKDWKLLASDVVPMHGGRKEVSPHRSVAWVKLENKETGEVVVHMNTHLISGAWNNKPNKDDPWRKKIGPST